MKKTAVQKLLMFFIKLKKKNITKEDMFFDNCMIKEKEQMKSAFIAGIFASDLMNKPNFDLDNQFDKWYYKEF